MGMLTSPKLIAPLSIACIKDLLLIKAAITFSQIAFLYVRRHYKALCGNMLLSEEAIPMAFGVEYQTFRINEALYYHDTLLLRYDIQYPQLSSETFPVGCINQHYAARATKYAQHCRQTLFRQAKEQFEEDQQTGAPVRVFEAVLTYTVTLSEDCTLSLYFDKYEYTGGAHGSTVRNSDTWDLTACARIRLSALCAQPTHCREYVIGEVVRQIEAQIADGETYFDDYRRNAAIYFSPQSFYLVPESMTVYYQQYELAPYASGIREFLIPYSQMIEKPGCN
jgi:hypothetical protein